MNRNIIDDFINFVTTPDEEILEVEKIKKIEEENNLRNYNYFEEEEQMINRTRLKGLTMEKYRSYRDKQIEVREGEKIWSCLSSFGTEHIILCDLNKRKLAQMDFCFTRVEEDGDVYIVPTIAVNPCDHKIFENNLIKSTSTMYYHALLSNDVLCCQLKILLEENRGFFQDSIQTRGKGGIIHIRSSEEDSPVGYAMLLMLNNFVNMLNNYQNLTHTQKDFCAFVPKSLKGEIPFINKIVGEFFHPIVMDERIIEHFKRNFSYGNRVDDIHFMGDSMPEGAYFVEYPDEEGRFMKDEDGTARSEKKIDIDLHVYISPYNPNSCLNVAPFFHIPKIKYHIYQEKRVNFFRKVLYLTNPGLICTAFYLNEYRSFSSCLEEDEFISEIKYESLVKNTIYHTEYKKIINYEGVYMSHMVRLFNYLHPVYPFIRMILQISEREHLAELLEINNAPLDNIPLTTTLPVVPSESLEISLDNRINGKKHTGICFGFSGLLFDLLKKTNMAKYVCFFSAPFFLSSFLRQKSLKATTLSLFLFSGMIGCYRLGLNREYLHKIKREQTLFRNKVFYKYPLLQPRYLFNELPGFIDDNDN